MKKTTKRGSTLHGRRVVALHVLVVLSSAGRLSSSRARNDAAHPIRQGVDVTVVGAAAPSEQTQAEVSPQVDHCLRKPGGFLFVHIFTHHRLSYHFVARDHTDWMSRYFFTGGQMPAHDLLAAFQDDLTLRQDWKVNGRHYQQTAEHWLQAMDRNREKILPLFAETYSQDAVTKWWVYWRVFYMACAELWGYRQGEEWLVSHYLFESKST